MRTIWPMSAIAPSAGDYTRDTAARAMAESAAVQGFAREVVRRALDLARFAPSAHNTQPWRVSSVEGALVVGVDPRRHLEHGDPNKRDLDLALGGFVEAIAIALRSEGVGAAAILMGPQAAPNP